MKKLKVTDQSLCMNCLACEWACSTAFYKDRAYGHDLSCIKVDVKDNGDLKTKMCIRDSAPSESEYDKPFPFSHLLLSIITHFSAATNASSVFSLVMKITDRAVSYTHLDVYKRQGIKIAVLDVVSPL